jgi:hypothetical protein
MRPSKRPRRLNISVTREVYDTVIRLAELNETSISVCLSDMLEAILPGMKHSLELLEEALKLDTKAKNDLARALERHEVELRQAVEHAQKATEEEVRQHKLPL